VCLIALAATGAAYAALTGPLLQVLLSGGARGARPFLGFFLGAAPAAWTAGGPGTLLAVGAVVFAVALVKGLANLGQAVLLEGTAERIGHSLRMRMLDHLVALPLRAHQKLQVGDLLARLLEDVRRVQDATVAVAVTMVREGLGAIALLAVAIGLAPHLALLAGLALPPAGVAIGLLARSVKRASAGAQDGVGAFAARAARGLSAIREVKSCSAEAREVGDAGALSSGALALALRRVVLRALSPLVNELLAALALAASLAYAGHLLSGRTPPPPERIVSFFAAVLLLYRPIKEIGLAASTAAAGRASVARLEQILALVPEERSVSVGGAPAEARLEPLHDSFVLEGVSFAYEGAERPALEGVDLELGVGRLVALEGASGAGKSTLANIVAGLDRPSAGRCLWDGQDLARVPLATIRMRVALLPQEPLLLDGSLAENLRFGAPAATVEEMERALEAAALTGVVSGLPSGLDTPLGADGLRLSVGEIQRLALARALLRRASLLVLDEPSSALDLENEARLAEVLRSLRPGRAILLVTHRSPLSSVADEVVRLEAGRLSRRGA
jgi:ABC-type multidrug transport system fused ATPase/permease subunit